MSGLNRYTEGLLSELLLRKDVIAYTSLPEFSPLHKPQVGLVPQLLSRPGTKGNFTRLLWYQTILPFVIQQQKTSLFYSPVPEGMLFPMCRQIVTIADLVAILFPESVPVQQYYFRYVIPRLIKASTAIVAISEATKRDVEHYYAPNKPIHVVYPSYDSAIFRPVSQLDAQQVKQKYGLEHFVLSVGEMRPYKNIRRLIEAFARISLPNLKLAIVGKTNKLDPDITKLPTQLGIVDRVKFLDYVPDQDLAALYSAAQLFVFPSLYEGFGIPLLEAMACGCPIVSSDSSSLPEVAGNAAVYCQPTDVDSIAQKICEVAGNEELRQSLVCIGMERVKNFTYKNSANKVIEICNEVLESFRPLN